MQPPWISEINGNSIIIMKKSTTCIIAISLPVNDNLVIATVLRVSSDIKFAELYNITRFSWDNKLCECVAAHSARLGRREVHANLEELHEGAA